MANEILMLSQAILGLSALVALARVIKGPTLVDRSVAAEVVTLIIMALITIHALETGLALFLDVVLVWAMLTFIAASALGLQISKGREK
jgi:multicomponent Na+:H+ antiporter subunit F